MGSPKVPCVPAVRTFCGHVGRLGHNVASCSETIGIVDASATGKVSDAAELFFEYMAATLEEVGWPVPTEPSQLPEEWRSEVESLASAYPPPGGLLVAYRRNSPIGAVGMQVRDSQVAEVKHLYVRPDERGGIGRLGTVSSTTIKATQVIVQTTGGGSEPSTAASVVPFQKGVAGASKQAGQIPASYSEGSGTIVSGTTANNTTEAALTAYPGGIVDRVVKLSNGEYEVHTIGVNWPHHVFVNQDFKVVGAE